MSRLAEYSAKINALLEKFNLFRNRIKSESELLVQELQKYIVQMDFEAS